MSASPPKRTSIHDIAACREVLRQGLRESTRVPDGRSRHSSDFATHLTRRFRGGNVGPPSLEGFPTFREKLVALVNSCNPRDRAGLVIEDLIGDVGRNAESGHARDAGPAQVVEPPPSNTGELIEDTFGSTEFLEGLGSEHRKHILPRLVCPCQHSH
jgi:hypothetical protein